MTIHIITPVHNRADVTRNFIDDLCQQTTDENIAIYIIDDGSTDGTSQMLADKADASPSGVRINVITGDGNWWWSKSMNAGIEACVITADQDDVVLFMNDDIRVPQQLLESLCEMSKDHRAIVAAQVNEFGNDARVLDRGALLDERFLALKAVDVKDTLPDLVPLDIASGRTTAFPAQIFLDGLRVDEKRLTHYVADIEFSVRARKRGFPIFLLTTSYVLSADEFGVNSKHSAFKALTAVNSPLRIASHWAFWRTAAPSLSPLTTFIRFVRYHFLPNALRLRHRG